MHDCYRRPVLFIDPCCPAPYSAETLVSGFLGGTEATIVRVLSGLPGAVVMQHNRTTIDPGQEAYRPIDWSALPQEGPIVVLRSAHMALEVRQRGWRGPLFLWMHDIVEHNIALAFPHLRNAGVELVMVSDWHRRQALGVARVVGGELPPMPAFRVIPNPLDPRLPAPGGERDPNRLTFVSMPNKGLYDVLWQFQALRARHPQLELHIAHRGDGQIALPPGVRVIGLMTHARAVHELAQAWCMFSPNMTQPETFGIVYAEANAVGTPVLAHDFGAAREVLGDERQVVNAYQPGAVIERFESWREQGPPRVAARDAFRLETVVEQWRALAAGA